MKTLPTGEQLLTPLPAESTIPQAAEILGCDQSTIWRLINETSHLQAYKRTKGRWAIPTARLTEIDQNRRAAPDYWHTLLRPTEHRPQQVEMF